jgi:hypothetical protein
MHRFFAGIVHHLKNKKTQIMEIVVLPALVAFLAFIIMLALTMLFSLFGIIIDWKAFFPPQLTWQLIYTNLGLFLLSVCLFVLILLSREKGQGYRYKWIFATFFLMALTLLNGVIILNYNFGEPKLDLVLIDFDTDKITGSIQCEDYSGKLIIGHKIHCNVNHNIKNNITQAYVEFLSATGSTERSDFSKLVFVAPSDLSKITFFIEGYDEKGDSYRVSVEGKLTFYTKEEYKERGEKFSTYFLAFIAAIFFSVPSMMNNLKNLCETRKERKLNLLKKLADDLNC